MMNHKVEVSEMSIEQLKAYKILLNFIGWQTNDNESLFNVNMDEVHQYLNDIDSENKYHPIPSKVT